MVQFSVKCKGKGKEELHRFQAIGGVRQVVSMRLGGTVGIGVVLLLAVFPPLGSIILLVWIACSILKMRANSLPVLAYDRESPFGESLLAHCTSIQKDYTPPAILCFPMLHCMVVPFRKARDMPPYERSNLRTSDGGHIALDWCTHASDTNSTPTVILLAGVGGNSTASYIQHSVWCLFDAGYRVVVANHRGTEGTPLTSPVLFSGTFTNDIRSVVDDLYCNQCFENLIVVGYSIGACILTKYLGEEGDKCVLKGAMAISHPCNTKLAAKNMSWLVDRHVLAGLQKGQLNFHRHFPAHHITRRGKSAKIKNVQDFDSIYTAPMNGYESVDAYYEDGDLQKWLPSIATPFLFLVAKDDPLIIKKDEIPLDLFRKSPLSMCVLTLNGGHLGWIKGRILPTPSSHMDDVMLDYCSYLRKAM